MLAPVWLMAAAAAPIEVVAGHVEVSRAGVVSADLVLRLVVANHGPIPVALRALEYHVMLGGAPFRAGRVAGPVAVEAHGRVEVPIAAEVGYGEAAGRVLAILARGAAGYRVVGSVRIESARSVETLAFDEAGTVPVVGEA